MRKSNNGVLIKALTMGVLLSNGGIGSDGKEKGDSDSSKTPYKSTSTNKCEGCSALAGVSVTDISFKPSSQPDEEIDLDHLMEERERMEREALRQPRVMDLQQKSVVNVLNMMKNAKLLSAGQPEPVKVSLTLNNISPLQLENIMFDENYGYIEDINWTLVGKPQDLTEDGELIDEDEKDLKKTRDEDEDDMKKIKDEDEEDLKKTRDEDEEDMKKTKYEDEDDLDWVVDQDDWEDLRDFRDLRERRGVRPHVHPRDNDHDPYLRRAVARGRYGPQIYELMKDSVQEHLLLPPSRLMDYGPIDRADSLMDPRLVTWGSTPKNEDAGVNPSLSMRNSHKGLVHIFCRQDHAIAAKAQAAG